MDMEATIKSGGYNCVLHPSLMLAQTPKERSELTEIGGTSPNNIIY